MLENDERRLPRVPGERPLMGHPKEEKYAQARALGLGQRAAAREAGLDDYTGIFAKYEAKRRVRDRIAYLRTLDQTPEYFVAKRRAIEQRLEQAAFGNFFECIEIVDGAPKINWEKLATSELGVTVSDLRIDKDTGKIVNMSRDNALGALQQLRDLRGFKAAENVRVSVAVETLSDEELLKIAQAAPALPAPEPATIDNEDTESS